jgi:hypothetical protein
VPLLQKILHTSAPLPTDWAVILACSLLPVAVVECVKLLASLVAKLQPSKVVGEGAS